MEDVTIFGFGSNFRGRIIANDIDFLIVHGDVSEASCKLAIDCKRCLKRLIRSAHVTMLSVAEERHFAFIRKAEAMRLGKIRASHVESDVLAIFDLHVALLSASGVQQLKPRDSASAGI